MKNLIDKVTNYIIIFGVLGLIMGVINIFKGESGYAKTGFTFFGVMVVFILGSTALSKIGERKARKESQKQPAPAARAVEPPAPTPEPLTVLGIIVLLERPLRFANDKSVLIQSILAQQTGEFKRLIAPTAQVHIMEAGASIDDDAYIYGACRSAFDGLSSYADNDEFLQRVATGSFTASDGNRGKHFAFLNRKL